MSSYRIMKLSNGDEIICKLHNTENGYFKVGYPMKMCTVNTMGKDGKYEENLALRKWATFTKDKVFAIEKTQVALHYDRRRQRQMCIRDRLYLNLHFPRSAQKPLLLFPLY